MKEISLSSTISGCSAQYYFEVLYKDGTAIQRYHEMVNKDKAVVSQWHQGSRYVEFNMPVNVSGTVKSLIGVDSIHVKEQQVVEWTSPNEFQLKSIPEMGFPGSSKFTTSVVTKVVEQTPKSLMVTTYVICNASLPWPLQSQVESIMAEQAKGSISEFLEFCTNWVNDAMAAAPPLIEANFEEAEATTSTSIILEDSQDSALTAAAEVSVHDEADSGATAGENEPSSSQHVHSTAAARSAEPAVTLTTAQIAPQPSGDEQWFDAAEGLSAEDLALLRAAARLQPDQLACLRSIQASSTGSLRLLEQLVQHTSVFQELGAAGATSERTGVKASASMDQASRSMSYSWILPLTIGIGIGCSITYITLKRRQ